MRMYDSTIEFPLGLYGVLKIFLIPYTSVICRKSADTNCGPLSVSNARMVPHLEIQQVKIAWATLLAVGSGNAVTSTHRVWWSISTSTWVLPRVVLASGPNRSAATTSNGDPIGRLSHLWAGASTVYALQKEHCFWYRLRSAVCPHSRPPVTLSNPCIRLRKTKMSRIVR